MVLKEPLKKWFKFSNSVFNLISEQNSQFKYELFKFMIYKFNSFDVDQMLSNLLFSPLLSQLSDFFIITILLIFLVINLIVFSILILSFLLLFLLFLCMTFVFCIAFILSVFFPSGLLGVELKKFRVLLEISIEFFIWNLCFESIIWTVILFNYLNNVN